MSISTPTTTPNSQANRYYALLVYTPELGDHPQSSPSDTDLSTNLYRSLNQAHQAAKAIMDKIYQSFIDDDSFDNSRLKRHTRYSVWHEPIAIEFEYRDHAVAKIEIRPVTL